ncbi:MFS transporter [Actinoallomurus sp. CA-150999]|uniref:MFS transporter n=1 Tax=Actinoallomurus sp. CA-150999 TaxID=3239887 RepID=UPI003D89EDEE
MDDQRLTLISEAFPLEKRGTAIGIWGAITGLGVAAGPLLGGAIIQGISWQWIFWINVPVGAVSIVLSMVRLRESHGPRPQLDLVGLPLIAFGLVALVWAPVRAPSIGWGSDEVIGALVAGGALILAFLLWEGRARFPMMPPAYFRRRGFATSGGVAFFLMFSLIGSLFMIAQMFQVGLGYSPLTAGVRILVWTAMPMLVAPVAGVLSDRFGNRPFMAGGLVLMGLGLGWLGLVATPGVSYGSLVLPLIVAGVGISCVFPTIANAAVGSVPINDSGVAAGANNTVRETGGVFGVAVLAAVFSHYGGYTSSASFMHGFRYAMVVAGVMALVGVVPGILSPSKAQASVPHPDDLVPLPQMRGADAPGPSPAGTL